MFVLCFMWSVKGQHAQKVQKSKKKKIEKNGREGIDQYDSNTGFLLISLQGGWDKVCAHVVQLKFHRDSAQ